MSHDASLSPGSLITNVWPLSEKLEAQVPQESSPLAALRFATTNQAKLSEIARALGLGAEEIGGVKLNELLEPQPNQEVRQHIASGSYLEASGILAGLKAREAFRVSRKDVCVDDTGLYLDCLGGNPGPEIKSWCSQQQLRALCEIAQSSGNPKATFVVAFGYYPGFGEPQWRAAQITGLIANEPRGHHGFGFDCIFIPDPATQGRLFPGQPARTLAELSTDEKARLNPRVKALYEIAGRPFEFASRPAEIRLSVEAQKMASRDVKTPLSSEHVRTVEDACASVVSDRIERIKEHLLSPEGRKKLVWQGEVPERVIDNDDPRMREVLVHFDMGRLRVLSRSSATEILALATHRMELLNHPLACEAQLRLRQAGFIAVGGKSIAALDAAFEKHQAVTFDDYKLGYIGATEAHTHEERTLAIQMQGMAAWTSSKMVTSPVMGASVPSMSSAWAIAEAALCGVQSFVPCDSYWTDPQAQTTMAARAIQYINEHPFLKVGRWNNTVLSNGQTVGQFVKERALRLVGATLKARPEHIIEQADRFAELGISSFRVYEAGATRNLQAAVRVLSRATHDEQRIIYAGQVGGVSQGRECVEAGAHALIVGVGDGGLCSTADVAAVAANNPMVLYHLAQARLGVPIGADGGVGSRGPVAHAIGASFRMMAGSLAGGTASLRLVKLANGSDLVFDPEYGEASAMTKVHGRMIDALGIPMNIEGVEARRPFDVTSPHLAERLWVTYAGTAKALRFNGYSSLEELIHDARPNILSPSGQALKRGSPHHEHRETTDVPRRLKVTFEALM